MALEDPSGLVRRFPELEILCATDASLRQAVASGKPLKVFRALWWARMTGRLSAHRDLVIRLLKNRAWFFEPVPVQPSVSPTSSGPPSVNPPSVNPPSVNPPSVGSPTYEPSGATDEREERLRLIEGWVVLALVEHGYVAMYEPEAGWVMKGHGRTLRPHDLVSQIDSGDLSMLKGIAYSA